MYYVITLGQSDEKFVVGRNEYDRSGRISFVRHKQTFTSRSQAEKLASTLNGKTIELVDQ
jgi:hypothetical protein